MSTNVASDKVQLSDHFALWEFTTSQEAERRHIDNTPSAEVVSHLRTLCQQILEPARTALGPLRISSGYRSPALNASVVGSQHSAHLQGFSIFPVWSGRAATVMPGRCAMFLRPAPHGLAVRA